MTAGVRIILGLLVLLLGRRLYWIMVGVGGLLAGLEFAQQLLTTWSPPARFLVAIAAGVVGIVLAIMAQRVAFALLGFFGGGFIALALSPSTACDNTQLTWFLIAGVVGAIIAALMMDWAIIVLTSFAGATAIVTSFTMDPIVQKVTFVVLAAVGLAIQGRGVQRGTQLRGSRMESAALQQQDL